MEFTRKQADVPRAVTALQFRLPGQCCHTPHQALSTGPFVPGCEACVRGGYLSFQLGFACNARCTFCLLETHPPSEPVEDERYHRQALLGKFHRHKATLEGVSLTDGEPLLYQKELGTCVREMRKAKPSPAYTSGCTPTAHWPTTFAWRRCGTWASKRSASS